jgi:hypothetical protein
MDIGEIILQTVEGIIAKNDGATLRRSTTNLSSKGWNWAF